MDRAMQYAQLAYIAMTRGNYTERDRLIGLANEELLRTRGTSHANPIELVAGPDGICRPKDALP